MRNYNAASPYPSCFRNLTDEEKLIAHNSVLQRNINHLIECCNILKPKVVLPFAGAYVIGGKEHKKNRFLGTTTWEHCAQKVKERSIHNALTLREGDTYDLSTGEAEKNYEPISTIDQNHYISKTLSKIKYPYESGEPIKETELQNKVNSSVAALAERAQRYNLNVR